MKILKKSIGIDVSKKDFKVCLGIINEELQTSFVFESAYANDLKGINSFIRELKSKFKNPAEITVVMEATGVYHELLAYSLYDKLFKVVILLPNKAKSFCKSINIRAKSDTVDAKLLCQMALERNLTEWNPPAELFCILKSLTREREGLVNQRSKLKNQIHAYKTAFLKHDTILKRIKRHLQFIDKQIKEIETELKSIVKNNPEVDRKVKNICKVKGLSFITVITIISETSGFNLISNIKQLVGYAGLDVQINQSGTKSKKGKISKKGNSHIRKALFMPAMNASRSNKKLKEFYLKLNQRQEAKKQGIVAIQRKLLILTYSLWKNDQEYIESMVA